MKKVHLTFLVLCSVWVSLHGQGTVIWNETIDGPFSFDYRSPTTLRNMVLGTNTIIGATEIEPTGPNYLVHEDYFSFAVSPGAFIGQAYLTIDKPNVGTWLGDSSFSVQLGFAASPTTGDLLAQLSLSAVGAGSYGVYMANHDAQPFVSIANYRLDFVVQAIPEPGTLILGAMGGLMLVAARMRRPRVVDLHCGIRRS